MQSPVDFNTYFPSLKEWQGALFKRIDARKIPVESADLPQGLQGLSIHRATTRDLEAAGRCASLRLLILNSSQAESLHPLAGLSELRALQVESPANLNGLETLSQLEALALRHFPRIRALAPLRRLSRLRLLSLSTTPGWDASRRCLEVESLAPLQHLSQVEWISLMGIWPSDGRLEPLHGLPALRRLQISHVYKFTLRDFAELARSLPDTIGHCLEPTYVLPQLHLKCKRCGGESVFLTGAEPRTPRHICPACDHARLQLHLRRWHAALNESAAHR